MAPPRRRPCSPPPALMEELIEEILLRFPPDEPVHLVRAALVCKSWRRVLSDHGFLRRYRAFHRAPPLLGYIHNLYAYNKDDEGPIPPFVSTTAPSPLSPPALDHCTYWWALDCLHGRVLISAFSPHHLIIWDPITGDKKKLRPPPYEHSYYAGAVLCAVAGCDHLSCHGGPFLVVCVGRGGFGNNHLNTWVSMYSSETDAWSASVSIDDAENTIEGKPSLLIGDMLYFNFHCCASILKYDLGRHELIEIESPGVSGSIAKEVEVGALGFVAVLDNCIYKWLWQDSSNGAGRWAQNMVMELDTLLPSPVPHSSYEVTGLVEGTDTLFISGYVGVFTLELKSRKVKKVGERVPNFVILPYMSFYTSDLAKGRLSPCHEDVMIDP